MSDPEPRRLRVVKEILGDVDYYEEGAGPNGPWSWSDMIRVVRNGNSVGVVSKDSGKRLAQLPVSDLVPEEDQLGDASAETVLYGWLARTHDEEMARL